MNPVFFLPYVGISILLLSVLAVTNSRNRSYTDKIAFLTIGLTVAYFFYIIIAFTSKAAFIDDFNLLDSFQRMLYSEKLIDRIKALFEQVNEHRFVFERSIMYLIYLVTGTPNIMVQIIIGNTFMLGILWLFYQFFQTTNHPRAYFVPVALVLFSLLYYENAIWGIAAIQNTPLIFFALLSAWGLGKETKKGDTIGILAAIVTNFTSGSGTAIWIVGVLILLVQKRYRFLWVWLLFAAVVVFTYFTFDFTMHSKDKSGLITHPILNFGVFLGFLGSLFGEGFQYGKSDHFSLRTFASVTAGGFVFLTSLVWLLGFWLNKSKEKTPAFSFLSGAILFILGTAAMLVVSRPIQSPTLDMHLLISSRYLIFSATIWAATYLGLLFLFKNSKRTSHLVFLLFLIVNAAIHFASYYSFIPVLANKKATLDLDKLYTEEHNGALLSFGENYDDRLFWNHPTAFKNLLSDLEKNKLYHPEKIPEPAVLRQIRALKVNSEAPVSLWSFHTESKKYAGFNQRPNSLVTLTVTNRKCPEATPNYFVIQSSAHQFILPAVPIRASVSESIRNLSFWECGFEFSFPVLKFPEGSYDIYLVMDDEEGVKIEKIKDQLFLSHVF